MRRKAYLIGSVALLAIFFVYLSFNFMPEDADSLFTFDVGGCQDQETTRSIPVQKEDEFVITSNENSIQFSHSLQYVCCAEINLKFEQNDNLLKVTEVNEGNACRCICTYDVSGQIDDLEAGNYNLEIYGVEYQDREAELMYSQEIEIK